MDAPIPLRPAAPAYPLPAEKAIPLHRNPLPPFLPLQNRPAELPTALPPASGLVPAANSAAQRAFVERMLPAAAAAERSTGIPAHFVVAHAALETGWGKSEPRRADGSPSFNVFGIKAGRTWQGSVAEAVTTEYVAGVAQTRVERFRAYGSYEEAFHDYANLLAGNPRYADVFETQEPASFARGLQAAGYATDPQYAAKLERIIGGIALRQLAAG